MTYWNDASGTRVLELGVLRQILYERFAQDCVPEDTFDLNLFERQIQLRADKTIYLSWSQSTGFSLRHGSITFAVVVSEQSFFGGPASILNDASNSDLWSPLIGHSISIHNQFPDVLIASTSGYSLRFCCDDSPYVRIEVQGEEL